LDTIEYSDRTCIIVVEIASETGTVLVDAVCEVLNIRGSEIEDTPSFGTRLDTD
jgi:purine-binding chemotaxis protein CheW